ncbi:helix-turn-helix transcriptional regulator [Chromobacterium vaccinii]|uniref:helix-turn-helix domain-containing protein n=1 Tax=Chromobacterium vaccinii TaxID=1108595 RepID=UPI003260F8E6
MGTTLAVRVGANIAEARKRAGLAQKVVAERIGMETESLSRIERGNALPGLATLDRLADILGISLQQLLSGASVGLSSLAATVQEEIAPLDDADRLFVVEQIRALSRKLAEKSK